MEDINKIKVIHAIKNTFSVEEDTLNKFMEQIEHANYKDNIERFFRGYKVEDNFLSLFAAMPWVKLIHSLGQDQRPALSKETYQVPDFTILFETSKKVRKPLLLEVKSVKGDSQSLEVMTKQLNACTEYSKIVGIPVIYAIYWEKYQMWTFNAIENFEAKTKKHKIKISDAFKNDLSVIVGDITFIISQPIYRKTVCDKSIEDAAKPQHEKFGSIISDSISANNVNFIPISAIESAIIDASITMQITDVLNEGDKTTITEMSDVNYFLKLSNIILRYLAIFGAELNEQYADTSRKVIIEFFKKLDIPSSFLIPVIKTPTSDILYQQAFEDSWVHEKYVAK